jgi:hypothetical protein
MVRLPRVPLLGGLAVVTALAGCVPRATRQRFASGILGGARLPSLGAWDSAAPPAGPARTTPRRGDDDVALAPGSGSRTSVHGQLESGTLLDGSTTAAGGGMAAGPPAGIVLSRLAAPHRTTGAAVALGSLGGVADVAGLRARVGRREPAAPLTWTLAASAALQPAPAFAASVTTGSALVDAARGDDRFAAASSTLAALVRPGDLLVFDRAIGGAPASLVAVVLGVTPHGPIEMMYVGGGVVRRGLVSPDRPSGRRDASGATLNTYLRHNRDYPPKGTRFLSGELLLGAVRMGAIAAR